MSALELIGGHTAVESIPAAPALQLSGNSFSGGGSNTYVVTYSAREPDRCPSCGATINPVTSECRCSD